MEMEDLACVFCGKELSALNFTVHLVQCYRKQCIESGVLPLCTCNNCCATRTHPGDKLASEDGTWKPIYNSPSISRAATLSILSHPVGDLDNNNNNNNNTSNSAPNSPTLGENKPPRIYHY